MPKKVRFWTDEEDEFLKKLWKDPRITLDQIHEILDRGRSSVDGRRTALGLQRRSALESQWLMEEKLKRYKEIVEG